MSGGHWQRMRFPLPEEDFIAGLARLYRYSRGTLVLLISPTATSSKTAAGTKSCRRLLE